MNCLLFAIFAHCRDGSISGSFCVPATESTWGSGKRHTWFQPKPHVAFAKTLCELYRNFASKSVQSWRKTIGFAKSALQNDVFLIDNGKLIIENQYWQSVRYEKVAVLSASNRLAGTFVHRSDFRRFSHDGGKSKCQQNNKFAYILSNREIATTMDETLTTNCTKDTIFFLLQRIKTN